MQALVRLWQQHPHNSTLTGKRYRDPINGEPKQASLSTLFGNSATLQKAYQRVNEKSPTVTFWKPVSASQVVLSDSEEDINSRSGASPDISL